MLVYQHLITTAGGTTLGCSRSLYWGPVEMAVTGVVLYFETILLGCGIGFETVPTTR